MEERTYTVLGTGALGGYYGARLHHGGVRVRFLLHSDFAHVRRHGLRVESPEGDFSIAKPEIYAAPTDLPPSDVVLVCLKSTGNAQLPELIPPAVGKSGVVVVMQNGLGIEEEIAAFLPQHRIFGGLSFLCSNKVGPGHIRHSDYGQVRFGEYLPGGASAGISACMRAMGADFERAGIPVVLEEDLATARWKKLVWNIPYNGLCALRDCPTDALMKDPQDHALIAELMHEVRAVAAAAGVAIAASFQAAMFENTAAMGAYLPSMLLDRRGGRPLEIDAIYAAPLAVARRHGVACPRMEELHSALRGV
ncbi:MAG: putative 2-dehydropantoate 2-reductase [Deltaproteobacteria bacterium]